MIELQQKQDKEKPVVKVSKKRPHSFIEAVESKAKCKFHMQFFKVKDHNKSFIIISTRGRGWKKRSRMPG